MAGSRAAREDQNGRLLPAVHPPAETIAPQPPVHLLTEHEQRVLAAFSAKSVLSVGQLRAGTKMDVEELRPVLQSLRHRGLLRKLNTVIESYCLRAEFTGGRMVGTAGKRKPAR